MSLLSSQNPAVKNAFKYFENFVNFEKRSPQVREYSLDRMKALLALWDNPQDSFKIIHVAGSKGKGSTCAYLGAILENLGFKTGIFASPHVFDYRERIRSPQGFFPDEVYVSSIEELRRFTDTLDQDWEFGRPSTFELLTLCSFIVFKKMKLEWVVLETGLGGRLDATNLVQPKLCLISRLELEHTEVLGPTLSHIAFEKSGIFKEKALLRSLSQEDEAWKILEEKASSLGISLKQTRPESLKKNQNTSYSLPLNQEYYPVQLAMKGDFQAGNLLLAAQGLEDLLKAGELGSIQTPAFIDAVQKAALETRLPGRIESLIPPKDSLLPHLILDGSHTKGSIEVLLKTFDSLKTKTAQGKAFLIFALAKDKDFKKIVPLFKDHFSSIFVSTPGSFKESCPEEVYEEFQKNFPGTALYLEKDPLKALEKVLEQSSKEDYVLICGSFYLCGELLPPLENLLYDRE